MHIINLTPLEPGVYNDHASDSITAPPDGWAYIPEDFPLPSTFPRLGNIEAKELTYIRGENGSLVHLAQSDEADKTNGVTIMTVTAMMKGTLPEPVPEPDPTPTAEERIIILEEQLAQSDEIAITLYEAQEAQETINAQQDEALMEIYEMIG
jgi:hypothetical protein